MLADVCRAGAILVGHVLRHKGSSKEQGEKICRVGDKGGSDKNTQAALPVKSRKKAKTI